MKKVNSMDVAKLAGVSRSAVSRTFTPGAYVSAKTREKVERAASILNYRPNAIARGLSKQRTGLIGVLAGELENPYYAKLIQQLSFGLQSHGLSVMLLADIAENTDSLVNHLLSYQVEGVIMPAVTLSSRMAVELEKANRPVILVNRYSNTDFISSVAGDNVGGGRRVAELLARGGHKRIAYMAGLPDTSSSQDRRRGLLEGLADAGLKLFAEDVGNYEYQAGAEAAHRLLSAKEIPDAVFCANDLMAVAAIDTARRHFDLSIPEDISIVGYDNTSAGAWPSFDLTSVDQHVPEMAQKSVELMIRKLVDGRAAIEHLTVPASLVVRGSTRKI